MRPIEIEIGSSVQLEFAGTETVKKATVVAKRKYPLGEGYSFQIGKVRTFVYSKDVETTDRANYYVVTDGR